MQNQFSSYSVNMFFDKQLLSFAGMAKMPLLLEAVLSLCEELLLI